MAKAGELDWTELHETGEVGLHPEEQAYVESIGGGKDVEVSDQKGGDKITKSDIQKDVDFILKGFQQPGIKSPSKEEFEAHLSKIHPDLNRTDEEWEEVEKSWNNFFNNFFDAAKQPVDNKEVEWGTRKSFRETLEKSQREQYEAEEKVLNKELTS